MAGKVVGLALHWPCSTDSVVYPTKGSVAITGRCVLRLSPYRGMAQFAYIIMSEVHFVGVMSSFLGRLSVI